MSLPHLVYVGLLSDRTGLGRVARALLLRLQDHWRITGVSLDGVPPEDLPFPVRRGPFAHDQLGTLMTRRISQDDPPALLWLYMDPGPTIHFLRHFPLEVPIISYLPVDAENVMDGGQLNRLATAIFLTDFGLQQARQGGYTGAAHVMGHGVDTDLYHPRDTRAARVVLGLPPDDFLVGYIGANQPRKRWDLALYAFREFLHRTPAHDAYLYCHCVPKAGGWDIPQLAAYLGISDRVVFPCGASGSATLLPEAMMPSVYSALDIQFTTSQGEGFGLTTLEGMACGTPQILPAFAALAEWPHAAAAMVDVTHPCVTTGGTNLVEWCVDYRAMGAALATLYADAGLRAAYRRLGYTLAQEPQFRWDAIAQQFQRVFEEVAGHAAGANR